MAATMNQFNVGANGGWSIEAIHMNLNKGKFVLPVLQRNPGTWTKDKKEKLIDSIFQGIVLAPIIMSENVNDVETKIIYKNNIKITNPEAIVYHVIDGGHRLHTICEFMDNQVNYNGVKYNQLDENIKESFSIKMLQIVIYKYLQVEQQTIIFDMVNQQRPLTPGETMNGARGMPLVEFTREIMEEYEDFTSRFKYSENDKIDMKDLPTVAVMIIQHIKGLTTTGKLKTAEVPTAVKINDFLVSYGDIITDENKIKVRNAFNYMKELSYEIGEHDPGEYPVDEIISRAMQNFISQAAFEENKQYKMHVIKYLNLVINKTTEEHKQFTGKYIGQQNGTNAVSQYKRWKNFKVWMAEYDSI